MEELFTRQVFKKFSFFFYLVCNVFLLFCFCCCSFILFLFFFVLSRSPQTKQKKNGPETTSWAGWAHNASRHPKFNKQYAQCLVKGRRRPPRTR
jgi:ABC-type Fe3+ transport system permease subunit